jgi:hypothetical protein
MKCIGFGKYEGKCNNKAGTKWSPYWCKRCNKLRLAHIDKRFVIDKALELIDNGHKVIVGYESMAIGGLEGYITLFSKAC